MHTVHTHKYNYKYATRNCKSSTYTFHKFGWKCRIYKYFCDCCNVRKKWLWLEQGILSITFHSTTRNMKIPDDSDLQITTVCWVNLVIYIVYLAVLISYLFLVYDHVYLTYIPKQSPSPLGKQDIQLFTTQYTPCMLMSFLCVPWCFKWHR